MAGWAQQWLNGSGAFGAHIQHAIAREPRLTLGTTYPPLRFGRSDGTLSGTRLRKPRGQQNLALIQKSINGAKNLWFGHRTVATLYDDDKTAAAGQLPIRDAVSPFFFLNFDPTDSSDAPWNKWMRVSNWTDLVCYVFDQQYPWGQGKYGGEPTNSAGRPSLRALYVYVYVCM